MIQTDSSLSPTDVSDSESCVSSRLGDENKATSAGRVKGCLTSALELILIPVTFFTLIAFLGRYHWAIELTTHFRFQYFSSALVLFALLLVFKRKRSAMAAGVLTAANALYVLPVYAPVEQPAETTRSIRVLFSNVYAESKEYDQVRSLVRETEPDVVLFAETHKRWVGQLNELKTEYPYSIDEPFRGAYGVAAYSRTKLSKLEVQWVGDPKVPVIIVETELDGEPIRIIGAHVASPGDKESLMQRTGQMKDLASMTASRDVPTAVIGDLNITPWSPWFSDFVKEANLSDSRNGYGNHPSWQSGLPLLRIPIDHCLVTEELVVKRREICRDVGSDHFPLLVEIAVNKQQQNNADSQQASR